MAEQRTRRFETFLAVAFAGAAALAIISPSDVLAVERACCFSDGSCLILSRTSCETLSAVSQPIGSTCDTVTCPVLCGDATAPACNGDCPAGQTCVETNPVALSVAAAPCTCVAEIAQGDSCVMQPQACAGDLPCEDGVCCNRICGPQERCDIAGNEGVCTSVVASPPMSNAGLILLVAILLAYRYVQVRRRDASGL